MTNAEAERAARELVDRYRTAPERMTHTDAERMADSIEAVG